MMAQTINDNMVNINNEAMRKCLSHFYMRILNK